MLLAHRVRTSAIIAGASATIVAALLLTGRQAPFRGDFIPSASCAGEVAVDGVSLTVEMQTQRILSGADDQHIAVTVRAPTTTRTKRPPLSVAIVIDRSGSMSGPPIEFARAAASTLLDQLGPDDAFSVVTYSTGEQVLVPMTHATNQAKIGARRAIAQIYVDGGTCISCGLNDGAAELDRTPLSDSVRRIVLISDGQANEGIRDRDQLALFAHGIADRGTSITSVGVGLDFDELTMQRIADQGRGNYYFVEDPAKLASIFGSEMTSLSATVASNATLTIDETAGFSIAEAYGYDIRRVGKQVSISVADLRGGDVRKIVLRATVARSTVGATAIGTATLAWRDVATGATHAVSACIGAEVVDDARAVADSVNLRASSAIEEALAARALEEAVEVNAREGAAAAQKVLDYRMEKMRSNAGVSADSKRRIEAATGRASESFKNAAPAKAAKASRADAYDLAR